MSYGNNPYGMFDEPLILVEEESLFCGLTVVFKRDNITKKRSIECSFCDLDRIQTCNLLIRSQMLYSVELRDRCHLTVQR